MCHAKCKGFCTIKTFRLLVAEQPARRRMQKMYGISSLREEFQFKFSPRGERYISKKRFISKRYDECIVFLLEKRFGYSLPSSSPPLMGGEVATVWRYACLLKQQAVLGRDSRAARRRMRKMYGEINFP